MCTGNSANHFDAWQRACSCSDLVGKCGEGRFMLEQKDLGQKIVLETDLPGLKLAKQGKVRDIYDLGENFLIVSTDRISAFDVVLPNGIPGKGRVLTQISRFWFKLMEKTVPNHLVSTEVDEFPEACQPHREVLEGRSMLVRKAEPLPVECVVRGYLSGSGWQEYQESGTVCGVALPKGLVESSRLDEPLFTPATKAEHGDHDENISFEKAKEAIGSALAEQCRTISLSIYESALNIAEQKGIIVADTKLEFGLCSGTLVLIDELLTPDSSRFWFKDQYEVGKSQESLDKQYVRDYLSSISWNKQPPAPLLPAEVVQQTAERYQAILEILTGSR